MSQFSQHSVLHDDEHTYQNGLTQADSMIVVFHGIMICIAFMQASAGLVDPQRANTREASPGRIGKQDRPGGLGHIAQQHAGLEAVCRAQHVLVAALGQGRMVIPLQFPQRHLRKTRQQVVLLCC